jgi:hypothetical protein
MKQDMEERIIEQNEQALSYRLTSKKQTTGKRTQFPQSTALLELVDIAEKWLKADRQHFRILCHDYEAQICERLLMLNTRELRVVRELFKQSHSVKK